MEDGGWRMEMEAAHVLMLRPGVTTSDGMGHASGVRFTAQPSC